MELQDIAARAIGMSQLKGNSLTVPHLLRKVVSVMETPNKESLDELQDILPDLPLGGQSARLSEDPWWLDYENEKYFPRNVSRLHGSGMPR
jgi:hypothetical protein